MSIDKAWPLDIYRHSVARGWEKQVPKHLVDAHHSLKANAMGVPKVGCIDVKRYKLKIRLTTMVEIKTSNAVIHDSNENNEASSQQQTGHLSSRDAKSDGSSKSWKVTKEVLSMEIVRRHNAILLSPKKSRRTILLKFFSVRDCVEFSDELLRLNRHFLEPRHIQTTETTMTLANAGRVRPGAAEGNVRDMMIQNIVPSEKLLDPLSVEIQMNDVRSYLMRILNDQSFLGFADKIQKLVEASPDTAQMLQAASMNHSIEK